MKWTHFILICYLLMLTFFFKMFMWFSCTTKTYWWSGAKCSYHSQLMFMWFSCTKTYWWSGCTSSSFVIYCFWLFTDVDIFFVWKIFYNFNTAFDYLLMLTYFSCENVLIILDWCLCDFLVLKHINTVHILHLHLSFTDVDIFSCWKCPIISILFLIIYWCWLFFMCKMFLSFLTDVYVIFLYWNISIQCTYFIFICHLLMLTYFRVENVPQFQYCFWLFTDVDYFSCAKCSYHFLIIFHNFNIAFDYLLMLTIFHVPKFP